MSKQIHDIGVLISTTGSYGNVGETILNGCMLACEEIRADPSLSVELSPLHLDPGGDPLQYVKCMQQLISRGIRHIVGCYTSISRKEVLPTLEKHNALLFYPTHYEGFEISEHVIYTGASPNHHTSPLIGYLVKNHGARAFCIGSNYIWAWESNRTLREGLQAHRAKVLTERYLPVGETDMQDIIESIFQSQPDFIFNTLIGESSYEFFRQFRKACLARGIDQPSRFPIASCNLSEADLECIGTEACDGHISSSVYFASLDTSQNQRFVQAYRKRFPNGPAVSVETEASYIATWLLAYGLQATGGSDSMALREAIQAKPLLAPQGRVWIDGENLHAWLTPRLASSMKDFSFRITEEAPQPVRPDPYMLNTQDDTEMGLTFPRLRIVS
jgi:branched-chain amino acid transport system substrate-binding protein